MSAPSTPDFRDGMPFLGGALWLDLINSAYHFDGVNYDCLADAEQFTRWVSEAGLPAMAPERVEAERQAAKALRLELREIEASLDSGKPMPETAVEAVNSLLSRRWSSPRLVSSGCNLDLTRVEEIDGPQVAGAIALDFAEFIVAFERESLKGCANPDCTMAFYDRGKNNRRRWCTMAICGNRAKVAAYRERKLGSSSR